MAALDPETPRVAPHVSETRSAGEQIPLDELGPRFEQEGCQAVELDDGGLITISNTMIGVEDRMLPEWVNFKLALTRTHVAGEPWMLGRVAVREGVPQCVSLVFTSGREGREIRQSDLRSVEINMLVIDLMAALSIQVDQSNPDETIFRGGLPGVEGPGEVFTAARRFMERRRRKPGLRDITPQLLERVAETYRANINHAPTEAVAKTFGVKQRMASTYVQRARTAGYLPATKQGKKQA